MAETRSLDRVVIRFAEDSGDGIQLTGDCFTAEPASLGGDIVILPNYPAEIRTPQGTLPRVSSFQVHFADYGIVTPGDQPDVLVAMNPAALKANPGDLPKGGVIIVDKGDFTKHSLARVGWDVNPLVDGSLADWKVHSLDLTGTATVAAKPFGLRRKDAGRTRNTSALGSLCWLYSRDISGTIGFLKTKFMSKPEVRDANLTAFRAGHAYKETTEVFEHRYHAASAPIKPGRYHQIAGNPTTAYGLMASTDRAGMQLFLGSYPITPVSDILHELSRHKDVGVVTVQAEDEIAGVCSALGASYAGLLGVTTTSGLGMALKMEAVGLGVMTKLPLVIVDVQRAGPSTGAPTKTEQAGLSQAAMGHNDESPVAVLAARSPADYFAIAVEACRIAVKYHTPAIVLTNGYLGNGARPQRIPDLDDINPIVPGYATEPNAIDPKGKPVFHPYLRDENLARAFVVPGTPGLEHRIGGLEKNSATGVISCVPDNHDLMVRTRQAKIDDIARDIPDIEVHDPSGRARLLVLGWDSTYGPTTVAVHRMWLTGREVAMAHLRHLNPMPANLGEALRGYDRVLVPEMNLGQLAFLLRARYLVDAQSYSRVRGLPISMGELEADLTAEIGSLEAE